MRTARTRRDGVFAVREYTPADRDRVRVICFATGYMGDPVEWQWRDAESFADLFSGYYTDEEPVSAYVGEVDGTVVGYLLGCVDTAKAGSPVACLARHALGRLLVLRPGTCRVLWRMASDTLLDAVRHRGIPSEHFVDGRWPAHLHIDLLPEGRGAGLGRAMVELWLSRLRETGSPGCHIETFAENTRALRFFESVGFSRWGDAVPVPGLRQRDGGRLHLVRMVRSLG
jgi:ribosomal protein S18 acetylase RimI-like enzyme